MQQRGRKGATLGVAVSALPQRLEPPDDLNAAESAIWRRIVNSRPADYFQAADAELLRAFVAASAFHEAACRDVRERGILVANERGTLVQNQSLIAIANLSSSMKALGTALRLTQQSRYSKDAAATKKATPGKPWDSAA